MKRILSFALLLFLLLPSCSPSDGFQAGRPVTPDELASISAELFTEACEPADTEAEEEQAFNPNRTVYWLKDGSVYHLDPACSHLAGKRNVKETTLRTAESGGLSLCKDCGGS